MDFSPEEIPLPIPVGIFYRNPWAIPGGFLEEIRAQISEGIAWKFPEEPLEEYVNDSMKEFLNEFVWI